MDTVHVVLNILVTEKFELLPAVFRFPRASVALSRPFDIGEGVSTEIRTLGSLPGERSMANNIRKHGCGRAMFYRGET